MAPTIKVGDTIPEGALTTVLYTPELEDGTACGIPSKISPSEAWKGKKIVLFAVPGAFTSTCHQAHLPPYLAKYDELKAKGVDAIVCLAANDAFVLSGWGRVLGVKDKILMVSDPFAAWAATMGLDVDLTHIGFGVRTSRFAMIIDDCVVKYVEQETASGVTVSGVDSILKALD